MPHGEAPDSPAPEPAAHRVGCQVTDAGTELPQRFLRSVANLLADPGDEGLQVELVAHGPGLDLLSPEGPCASTVGELHARGVTFLACENTLRGPVLPARTEHGGRGHPRPPAMAAAGRRGPPRPPLP